MEHPKFRKAQNGTLLVKASDEAMALGPQRQGYRAKQPEEVEANARAHVASEGGDVTNATLVLSRWKVQFGSYQGKTSGGKTVEEWREEMKRKMGGGTPKD